MRRLFVPLFVLLLAGAATLAQAAGLDAISSGDAAAGVKEALAKGADVAIASLGKKDGFLGNAKVKIPLPGTLQKAEKGLRLLGMGKQADELVDTMNHAAENAVAEARPILADAIKKMTVRDAKGILTGGDDSVTQYFKRSSAEPLTQKFLPIVKTATGKLRLAEQYNNYAGKAASMGLIDGKDADINAYVTQKAMDGLFLMIAEEERKLRANPLAAGSALLKKVFGAL
ncbi:MAG: DUF4197 domain-containing protein [Betaproteobacteria bacterium]|nr:DUF4197 domain-containing protein [Betaproteobacteria bacterium]